MTPLQILTAVLLGAGLLGVLAVGFFTGFANTWPIVAFVLAGAFVLVLLDRGRRT